jgi:hypothetical protein
MTVNEVKGILRRKAWLGITLAAILFFAASSHAETLVIGEGVSFRPGKLTPGGTLNMDIRFTVSGAGPNVPIAFSIVEAGRTPDWRHPSIPTATFSIGSYTLNFRHTIPASIPSTGVCLNVYAHFTRSPLTSALLINNACYGAGTTAGTGQRIVLNHDLAIKINSFSVDRTRDLQPGEEVTYPGNLSFTISDVGLAPFAPFGIRWEFSLYLTSATSHLPAGWNITAAAPCDPIPQRGSVTVTKALPIPDKTSIIKVGLTIDRAYKDSNESNNTDQRGVSVFIPSGREPFRPGMGTK